MSKLLENTEALPEASGNVGIKGLVFNINAIRLPQRWTMQRGYFDPSSSCPLVTLMKKNFLYPKNIRWKNLSHSLSPSYLTKCYAVMKCSNVANCNSICGFNRCVTEQAIRLFMPWKGKKMLHTVPVHCSLNTISSGKFSALGPLGIGDWTRIITGNPNGGWECAGCKWSFLLDWLGWSTTAVAPSLAQVNINLLISRSPSSLKLFLRGGIELQPTLVTDLTAPERRKHSFNNLHICAW